LEAAATDRGHAAVMVMIPSGEPGQEVRRRNASTLIAVIVAVTCAVLFLGVGFGLGSSCTDHIGGYQNDAGCYRRISAADTTNLVGQIALVVLVVVAAAQVAHGRSGWRSVPFVAPLCSVILVVAAWLYAAP
jgi:hypothetical protein